MHLNMHLKPLKYALKMWNMQKYALKIFQFWGNFRPFLQSFSDVQWKISGTPWGPVNMRWREGWCH